MKVNTLEIVVVIALALALLIWLVIRNRKDEEDFKKDELEDSEFVEPQDPEKE
jgi:cytoskeletal protein RodZ